MIEPLVTHLVMLVYALEVDEEYLRRIVLAKGELVFYGICLCIRGRCIQTGKIIDIEWFGYKGLPTSGRNFSISLLDVSSSRSVGNRNACVAPLFAALRARYGVACHPKSRRHCNEDPPLAGWQARVWRGETPFGSIQRGAPSLHPRISAQDIAFKAAVRVAARGGSRDEAADAVRVAGILRGWVLDAMLSGMFDDTGAARPVVAARLARLGDVA
ncbi:MAG: hypothetical protein J3K34DRAFT_235312 [Monoraphidium minutum]|nr:MAG: hypothetical protein J3K34DRAFT_235312 [Monoraphidium minutum]